ncbi:unnamed protein product, partial [Meganyctiphanes norvegica]|uniref:EF-hand domain-containing protein n=1 Tax=Meganyctiphanes norvegica TaxID=48144 RepID=A0AAV2PQX5_MEGNR
MPAAKGKKKAAKKSESCIFDKFSQKQIAEFKEGFLVMDKDKDGLISESDLAAVFAEIGRPGTASDFSQMVADAAPNPMSLTVLLNMFASKSSGEQDDDDAIIAAFRSFEGSDAGKIDPDQFKTMLQAFGDKLTDQEVVDVMGIMELTDDGQINSDALLGMLVAKTD